MQLYNRWIVSFLPLPTTAPRYTSCYLNIFIFQQHYITARLRPTINVELAKHENWRDFLTFFYIWTGGIEGKQKINQCLSASFHKLNAACQKIENTTEPTRARKVQLQESMNGLTHYIYTHTILDLSKNASKMYIWTESMGFGSPNIHDMLRNRSMHVLPQL